MVVMVVMVFGHLLADLRPYMLENHDNHYIYIYCSLFRSFALSLSLSLSLLSLSLSFSLSPSLSLCLSITDENRSVKIRGLLRGRFPLTNLTHSTKLELVAPWPLAQASELGIMKRSLRPSLAW